MRVGERVVAAFDKRQQCNLGGVTAAFHLVEDIGQVGRCALQNLFHFAGVSGVGAGLCQDDFLIAGRQGETLAQACPEIDRCCGFGFRLRCLYGR